MKLHNLLNEQLILLDRKVATKREAIEILLKTFVHHYSFKLDEKTVLEAVLEREELGGTSFPTGIAIPHARLENLNDMVILILRPQVPIPDEVAPIKLVVLMLACQEKPNLYLNSLSSFLKLSQKTELFQALLTASHPKTIVEHIAEQDYSIVKIVKVEDLLDREVLAVRPEQLLGELIDFFYEHQLSYAPVVDAENHIVGEVSLADVLKTGFPDYTSQFGNLKFLKTFEPFENLLLQETQRTVKTVMKPVSFGCDPSTPVVELCFELLNKGRRHCPVIKGRTLLGVMSVMDILSKVMRG